VVHYPYAIISYVVKMKKTGKKSSSDNCAAPLKREKLVAELRDAILGGTYQPGDRLPNRVDLEARHDLGWITVQHAFDELRRAGLVVARRGAGTFVAERPPHLHRFALVFCEHPGEGEWSLRWSALQQEATRVARAQGVEIVPFYGVTGHRDEPDLQQLEADVISGRLAGAMFASPPYWLRKMPDSPVWRVPRVTLGTHHVADTPTVHAHGPDFAERAFDHLAASGRQRPACIVTGRVEMTPDEEVAHYRQVAADHGFSLPPGWAMPVHPRLPETARYLLELWLNAPAHQRPDALVVGDDHLIEDVTRGLAAVKSEAARRIEVIGQVNFPLVPASHLPVTRLGIHAGDLLATGLDVLRRQRAGESVPISTSVPIYHERELTAPVGYATAGVPNASSTTDTVARPVTHAGITADSIFTPADSSHSGGDA